MKRLLSFILAVAMLVSLMPQVTLITFAAQENNGAKGLRLSVLGASISTYAGISNDASANSTIGGNAVYYTTGRYGVYADDTWWMQAANDLGLELLVNNSWSGSSLLYERSGTVGAYVDRCVQLHNDTTGEEPDIIAIQMGTNDFQYYKDTLGTADIDYASLIADNGDGTYTYATPVTSLEAAAIVLHKISVRYPDAEVYYLNISQRVDGTDELIQSFNAELKQVVEHFGAYIVDIYGSAITMEDFDTYIGDGRVHPNKLGMDAYTEAFKRAFVENTAYEVETHTVSMELSGVTADYGDDKIVLSGDRFTVNLTAADSLAVMVTMGGKDITSSVHSDGTVTIDAVTDDVVIKAESFRESHNYRWEFDGTDLVCISGDNALTKNAGTTTDGVFSNTRYALTNSVVLRHDEPWVVEWKCEGTWKNSGSSTGGRLLSSSDVNGDYNARYIFKSATNWLIAMGEKTGSGSHNYGIALADYGIDGSEEHTYRLENHIEADGSNMVYLYVDGVGIGPMNNYYVGTTNKNTTSDWISGKDFEFPYMGTDTHGFSNCSIEYIQVHETTEEISLRYDDHYDVTGKTVEIVDAGTPTSYKVGYGVEENAVLDTAVVTLDGDTLVATGIGTAKVRIDGILYEITVTAAPISLILLAGQSNMQGSEGDANQSIVCPDGMVYATYGDRYTMTVDNATNFAPSALSGAGSALNVNGTTTNLEDWPVYLLNEAGAGKAGPDSGFAYEWVQQTGEKVWIVNAAHGGSSITTWQDGGANYEEALLLFSACQETLRKEIAAGHYTLSHMGYFWCQGCTDYSQTAQWYVNKYLTMHENFKTELAFDHDSDPSTADIVFEFGGIIPVRAGHEYYTSYRQGVYTDTTSKAYHESFKDLRFTGPRVAQYWMINNPELADIWGVCNIGESWVWMPDGTNGVEEYFQAHYKNGTVDYQTQVAQSASWYTPTTPADVHDSIHYNQIGYNEVGRESVRNALILLGEIEAPDVQTTVEFFTWDGYTPAETVTAASIGSSATLVVPVVYPIWKSKEVTYCLSDGLTWNYYDLLVDSYRTTGTLTAGNAQSNSVAVAARELASYSWELQDGILVSTGETENAATKLAGSFAEGKFVDTRYRLADPILLLHDQNWVLEWKMTGPWYDEVTTSKKLFCQDSASATPDSWCLLIKGNENRISIGYYGTTTHISYGLDLDNYGISMTDTHVYRLANHIGEDGSNTIYLFVDGIQVGPMTHYFTGSGGDMGTESNYLSGKDISFGYLGAPSYLLDSGVIEYISVVESNASQDIHFHDWSVWETVTADGPEGPGEEKRTCTCGETETRIVNSIWQTTSIGEHFSELPENACPGMNLWSVLEHDPTYYVNSKGDWDYHSSKNVPSVTIPVNPGDKIFATSFGAASVNGHGSSNGIRVTFFDINGVVKTLDPAGTYAEFTANGGYLIAPEGAIAVNIPMWNNSDDNEIYILNREHSYSGTTCTICGAAGWDTDGDGVLEILAIGNSFSVDALQYVYQIAQDLGIEEIVIGNLYISGCTLKTHAANAADDIANYTYYFNDSGSWSTTSNYKISTALESRSWDFISMQQSSKYSGVESTYNEDLTDLIAYVKARSDAKLVWHMTWAYQQDSTNSAFPTYGSDQMTMYNAIVSAVQNKIVTNGNFDLIVPNGTAVQNSRTSLLGDTTTRDGYHMSRDYGCYLTGLMFIKAVTGLSVDGITYAPSGVDTTKMAIAIESVNNAYANPFEVTESAYTGEAPEEGYILLQSELYKGAFWSPVTAERYNELFYDRSMSHKYFATIRFTRETLPVGSIIILADGWQYRPDGWITDTVQTGSREPMTTASYVVVTEEWWGDYTIRAFNISKVGQPSLTDVTEEEVRAAFRIYVPEEKHTHTNTTVVTAPTCTEGGYTTYTCTTCGDNYISDEVGAMGHSYESTVTEATCTSGGYTTHTCSVCGDTYVSDEVGAKGHSYERVVTGATCTTGGYTTHTCTVCGDTYISGEVGAKGHSYEKTVTEATCTTGGYTTHTCTVCGDTYISGEVGANGHSYESVVTGATCTTGGYTTNTCTVCGDSYISNEVEAKGHSYEKVVTEATCTEGGYTTHTCTACGDTYVSDEVGAKGHSYESVVTEATCTTGGYTTHTCTACDDSYVSDEVGAKGHSYESAVTEATCTTGGYTTHTCSVCADSYISDEVGAKGHSYEKTVTEATCTTGGYTTHTCTVCGDTYVSDEVGPKGHSYEKVVTEATCTTDGYTTHTCTVCGDSYISDEVGAKGHSYESIVTEATCTSGGYTTHTCSVCGDSYVSDEVGAKDHSYESVVTGATCTSGGYTTHTCSVCGDTYVSDKVGAKGHSYDKVVTEATCTTGGYTTHTCSVCGDTYISDEVGAKGHSYESVVTGATCTEPGYTTHTCAICGNSYISGEVGAKGHSYEEVVTGATCTTGGYTTYTCTECGDSYISDEVGAKGHSYESIVTEATCTSGGYVTHTCTACGDSFVSDEVGAKGHSYKTNVTEATCTTAGYTTHTCTACGDTYVSDEVGAKGHSYESVVTGATCTSGGYTTHTCTVCDDTYVSDEVGAKGHSYESIVTEATCTTGGYTTHTCTVCGNTYITDKVGAKGHSYEKVVTEATCTTGGYTTYTCTACGDTYVSDEVGAKGHSYESVVTGATCTSGGYTTHTCTICGDSYVSDEVGAKGHSYESVVTGATCTSGGYTTYTCTECGDSYISDEVGAKGHSYESAVTEATCTSGGYTTHTCTVCGDSYISDEVGAKVHDYKSVVTEATCTSGGYTTHTCTVCGDTYVSDEVGEKGHTPGQPIQENYVAPTEEAEGGYDEVICCTECGEELERSHVKLDKLPEQGSSWLLGDVNHDGWVDAEDAALIMQYEVGLIGENALDLTVADVNGDGWCDAEDAALIMQLEVGLIDEF